jgi:protein TonB
MIMAFALLGNAAMSQTDTSQSVQHSESEPEVYTIVEEMPKYPGGDAALLKYIAENIKYPPIVTVPELSIHSTFYLTYTVDIDGQVKDVRVLRGGNEGMNHELIRVIRSITGYEPGRQRGKPVPVQFTIPIRISLN